MIPPTDTPQTDQQRALSPNERKAREIVMCHDARCHGDIFPDKPYCSTLAFNEPLCPSCQTLQDAIAHALAEQAAIDAEQYARQGDLLLRLIRLYEPAVSSRIPSIEEVEQRTATYAARIAPLADDEACRMTPEYVLMSRRMFDLNADITTARIETLEQALRDIIKGYDGPTVDAATAVSFYIPAARAALGVSQ